MDEKSNWYNRCNGCSYFLEIFSKTKGITHCGCMFYHIGADEVLECKFHHEVLECRMTSL